MPEPLVSIIVPVYKVEKYLPRCIESILKQSYQNLEIILVDDGSPDNCGVICDEFARLDQRIRVIHKENQGVSAARNTGLDAARGEYISFVDSDDYIDKDTIKDNLTLLLEQDADMVCFNYYFVKNGKIIDKRHEYSSDISYNNLIRDMFECNKACATWCKLYHRSVFNNVVFPLNIDFEDAYAIADILINAKKVIVNDNYYYYYEQTNTNSLTKTVSDVQAEYFKIKIDLHKLDIAEKYFPDFYDKRLHAVVRRILRLCALNYIVEIYHNESKEWEKFLFRNKKNIKKLRFSDKITFWGILYFKPLVYIKGLEYYLKYKRGCF